MTGRVRAVLLALVVIVLVSGCRASSERRLVSLRESKPVDDVMSGEVVYAQTEGIRRSGLYVRDMEEGESRRLDTGFEGYVNGPAWSPDGRAVAYSASAEDAQHLWWIPVAGGAPVRITSDAGALDDNPRWSPDGRRLVFQSIRDGAYDWHLYVTDLDGTGTRRLGARDGHSVFPDWSPDGRHVVYSHRDEGRYRLRVIDVVTGEDRALGTTDTEDMQARWSPDGRSVTYAGGDEKGLFQLYRMDVETGTVTRILGSDSSDQFPALSPDGRWVVFSTGYLSVYDARGKELPNGKLRWRLTDNLAWAPDWYDGQAS